MSDTLAQPAHQKHTQSPWKTPILVSLLLLVPCFWQSRIQSIDLCSHIYNAWLSSLIAQNQAPGLWIAHQSNNVLFDWILAWLFRVVGSAAAQRIAVSISVLIFAWGAILLICRLRPRNWWFVLPTVSALTYGFVFTAGFFNFYLALGLCFWYLAFFLSSGWRCRLLTTPLLVLAWMAHPLPILLAAGMAAYVAAAEFFPKSGRILLLVLALITLLAVHFLLLSHYQSWWSFDQAWFATGAKQLALFGSLYWVPCSLFIAAWAALLWRRMASRGWDAPLDVGFQIWLLTAAATVTIPTEVILPGYFAGLSFISERLSLITAVTLGVFLIEVQPKHFEKVILAAAALIFFALVFRDAWKLNRMEDRTDAALSEIPPYSRVIGRLRVPSQDLGPGEHQVDRACVGRCFSYANYEPSTGQFRVRAMPRNRIVMADYGDVHAVEAGEYRMQPSDLPAFLVYLCGSNDQQVCSRRLRWGDVVGTVGQIADP